MGPSREGSKIGIPGRTCIGCRRVLPRSELLRLARRPDGHVVVDEAGGEPGRGGYLCRRRRCYERGRRRIAGALRATDVSAVEEYFGRLSE